MPQVSHVTLGRRCFFPAPTRQIVINDITALAVLPREEILESAAPEVHEGGATDQRLELVGLDVMHVICPSVHVEHGEAGFPPVVMTEPFHQTGKGLGGRHIAPWVVSWLPIRTAARRSFPEREIGSTPEMELSTPLSGAEAARRRPRRPRHAIGFRTVDTGRSETILLTPNSSCEACSVTRVVACTLASPIRKAAIRRLQPCRYLHDCSGCFRLEQFPGGTCTHWQSAALSRRTPNPDIGDR